MCNMSNSEVCWALQPFIFFCSGYYSGSFLGELSRNGQDSWCNACDSADPHLRKLSFRSKASWIQTHREIKIAYSLFSFQPNWVCLPQETTWTDCCDCCEASQTSGRITKPYTLYLLVIMATLLTFETLTMLGYSISGVVWRNIWTHYLCTRNSHKLCIFARHVWSDSDSEWIF